MECKEINGVTYWLPENEVDVCTLVNDARTHKEVICVRGAAHSFPLIGTLEKNPEHSNYKYVLLSKMNKIISYDDYHKSIKVQGGCHLGADPFNPTGPVLFKDSLLGFMESKNLALPDLGGISHQTVAGFLATASSGGSTKYSLESALVSIEIINCSTGVAKPIPFTKPNKEKDRSL